MLTGSHGFELMHSITQSLAGRPALLELLPMSIAELRGAGIQGSPAALHYYRDSSGLEVDLLVECGVPPGHGGDEQYAREGVEVVGIG